jgi:pyruvate kinase
VSCTYQSLSKDVKHGDAILLDDGNLEVRVTKIEPNKVYTKVIVGGILKSKKGVNLPDSEISEASLTKKDKEDLVFGLKNEVDWVAISFVRKASDVAELKDLIKQHNSQARVIAKIERPEAIKNIDEIIEVTDGLMVARGDLGVEIDLADVPMEQKKIIIKCNQAAKPVIVATQMMESMITNARPTRAEAGDVANAVIDGADAVMLSAETASGKYPVLTVQYMKEIIKAAEKHPNIYHKFYAGSATDKDFNSNIIIDNACRIARAGECKAIVGMTYSGFAAFRISRHRPTADIHIFTANKQLLYILNLVWGIRTYYYGKIETTDTTISAFENILINAGHLRKGETFVSTGTIPIQSRLRTNMVKFNIVS